MPDSAVICVGVTRLEKEPFDSLSKAKESAGDVAEFLRRSNVDDFGMSRIQLNREPDYRPDGKQTESPRYSATVQFKITIGQLDRLEEIVLGVVKAGANDRLFTHFLISKLKDVRMQARHLAIEAAKEKGAIYAQDAGVPLGRIINMQEILNPEFMGNSQILINAEMADRDSGLKRLEPNVISVAAGVLVTFSLDGHPHAERTRPPAAEVNPNAQ